MGRCSGGLKKSGPGRASSPAGREEALGGFCACSECGARRGRAKDELVDAAGRKGRVALGDDRQGIGPPGVIGGFRDPRSREKAEAAEASRQEG